MLPPGKDLEISRVRRSDGKVVWSFSCTALQILLFGVVAAAGIIAGRVIYDVVQLIRH